jgi:hypothetical protein
MTESGRKKNMCFAATGRLQGKSAKLLLVGRKSWYNEGLLAVCLTANLIGFYTQSYNRLPLKV